ncbi:MAG: glycogen debranching protein [Clostridiales bacterium]|nr:glycogen debranching protein [Clostridiales bacterium]
MKMIYTKKFISTFEEGTNKQWLVTNGIGGYASSTIVGCNTRKYHALLVGPKTPPYNRTCYVSKVNETITVNGVKHEISTNECLGYVSKGFNYQTSFKKEYFPIFEYEVNDIKIKKQLTMIYGKNATVLKYEIETGDKESLFEIAPLINYRDFHATNTSEIEFAQVLLANNNLKIVYDTENSLFIDTNLTHYERFEKINFNNMYYRVEKQRGLDAVENHFIPGVYSIKIEPNTKVELYMTFSTEYIPKIDLAFVNSIFEKEIYRQNRIIDKANLNDEYANKLVLAADQFIIQKPDDEYGIIAGYPWFDEWGRDTFISFEGLLLVTKRYEIARKVLLSNVKHIEDGIMPNTFNNYTGEGLYNSVDAGLWFFEAVNRYIEYTNDYKFIIENIYPYMKEIVLSYSEGTLYNIHVDKSDGLLISGTPEIQLTWMDAKVGDKVITPRNGKCVEINALWYNALNIMMKLANELKDNIEYKMYKHMAEVCKISFNEKFWNSSKDTLYDVIEPYSHEIRPNQILALSLSYPLISGSRAKIILDTVSEHLYTPYGLRTLSQYSNNYIGKYYGDVWQRDSAYHQGTVWTWLLSEYIIAFCRTNGYSLKDRKRWLKYIKVLQENIVDDCIDSISEIFDGDYPHLPNGTYAQAWSVGNILKLFTDIEIGDDK